MCIRDRDLDLLVGGETGSETKFYTNDGNNVFTVNTTTFTAVSYTHLRAHETVLDLVCRLLLEKKKISRN